MMDDEISSSPPLWRKILHGVQDDLLNSLGYPATLRRRLNNGILPVSHPQLRNTFWLRSVVCWQTWLEYEKHCIPTCVSATTVIMITSSAIFLSWMV
ncbi:Uncharacterised protein [Raoultella terrigena]|uniref:Uncharacterized protein n=1 Tax=Raoultella terrigena TaxID=577 RepID=A0A3P8KN26_RAOTE|nr:Uncharacterised protein [Raoultella terrigena]